MPTTHQTSARYDDGIPELDPVAFFAARAEIGRGLAIRARETLYRPAPPPVIEAKPERYRRRVRRLEDGVEFESATAAADAVGGYAGTISEACRRGYRSKGYRWAFVGEDPRPPRKRRERSAPVAVRIGSIEFRSCNAAAVSLGCHGDVIFRALATGRLPDGRRVTAVQERKDRPRGQREILKQRAA